MSTAVPVCRTVTVIAFRGDRSCAFATAFQKVLDDEKNRRGPGPTAVTCLLFAGHTGASTDRGTTIYGFNPDLGNLPMWQGMQRLRNGDAFPGVVADDTQVFHLATKHRLKVQTFDVILPESTSDASASVSAATFSRFAIMPAIRSARCSGVAWPWP